MQPSPGNNTWILSQIGSQLRITFQTGNLSLQMQKNEDPPDFYLLSGVPFVFRRQQKTNSPGQNTNNINPP